MTGALDHSATFPAQEFSRLPQGWLERNANVDPIWTPSRHFGRKLAAKAIGRDHIAPAAVAVFGPGRLPSLTKLPAG
jgi:hypothetical protein